MGNTLSSNYLHGSNKKSKKISISSHFQERFFYLFASNSLDWKAGCPKSGAKGKEDHTYRTEKAWVQTLVETRKLKNI